MRTSLVHGALCEGGLLIARADDPRRRAKQVVAEIDLLLDGLTVDTD